MSRAVISGYLTILLGQSHHEDLYTNPEDHHREALAFVQFLCNEFNQMDHKVHHSQHQDLFLRILAIFSRKIFQPSIPQVTAFRCSLRSHDEPPFNF